MRTNLIYWLLLNRCSYNLQSAIKTPTLWRKLKILWRLLKLGNPITRLKIIRDLIILHKSHAITIIKISKTVKTAARKDVRTLASIAIIRKWRNATTCWIICRLVLLKIHSSRFLHQEMLWQKRTSSIVQTPNSKASRGHLRILLVVNWQSLVSGQVMPLRAWRVCRKMKKRRRSAQTQV